MISIVVPVYNEEGNLRGLCEDIRLAMEEVDVDYEVIFVDDGSTDRSGEVLVGLQRDDARVVVIELRRNFGQTAAMSAGFDHVQGDIIVTLDGDGQNDPRDIPAMLAELGPEVDVVAGWRFDRQDSFVNRRLPSQVANALIGWITGVHLHDYGCTLKVLRRDVVTGLRLYGEMHRFIPALAADLGAKIVEYKVRHHPRRHGQSKYGLSRILRVLLDLTTVKFLSSYSTRPIQVFGGVGILCGGAGLGITGWMGLQRLVLGVDLANRPIVWLGILLTIAGLQFVTMGLLGELLVRTYHESQDKPVYRIRRLLGR